MTKKQKEQTLLNKDVSLSQDVSGLKALNMTDKGKQDVKDQDMMSSHSEGVLQSKTTEESNQTQTEQSNKDTSQDVSNKDVSAMPQHDTKDQKEVSNAKPKNLDEFLNTLKPQEQKVLKKFIESAVYDDFITYLEGFFKEKDTLIHRINCYCFRVKEDFSLRIHGKIYELHKGEIIYIQKDSFGTSFLRNSKLERIL